MYICININICVICLDTQTAPINCSWGAWKECCKSKDLFILRNFVNCGSVFFSLFLKDDCLTSLTRFAAAHWTVSSLLAVQGHFCTLLACKFTTLFCFSQRYRYRKMLTEWLLVLITRRLFYVVVLSNRPRAGIFTCVPIHISSYRGKKRHFFWSAVPRYISREAWIFCCEGVLLILPSIYIAAFRKVPRAKEKEAWSFTKEKWYAGTLKRRKLRLV